MGLSFSGFQFKYRTPGPDLVGSEEIKVLAHY